MKFKYDLNRIKFILYKRIINLVQNMQYIYNYIIGGKKMSQKILTITIKFLKIFFKIVFYTSLISIIIAVSPFLLFFLWTFAGCKKDIRKILTGK